MGMKKSDNRLIESLTAVGGVLLLVAAAIYITGWVYAPYMYMVGAVMFAIGQFADRYDGEDKVMRRLRAQQVMGAIFLLLTGVLMWTDEFHQRLLQDTTLMGNMRSILIALTKRNNWIVTLTMGAIFELYSAMRIDRISRKEKQS